jgi:hypothetical protein
MFPDDNKFRRHLRESIDIYRLLRRSPERILVTGG